jgi:hypothetical protein
MVAFVALGVFSWAHLSDPRLRAMTLAVLGMFAARTWLARHRLAAPKDKQDANGNEGSPM